MRRWPIRIRLTAGFTAVMSLVLLVVGILTVAHTKESLDAAITDSLSNQLANLRPMAADNDLTLAGGGPDNAEQVISRNGQVLAATPNLGGQSALTPSEVDTARGGQLVADHSRVGNLEGPVRVAAGPAPDGRLVVAAQSLADRDSAVADLRNELATGFPLFCSSPPWARTCWPPPPFDRSNACVLAPPESVPPTRTPAFPSRRPATKSRILERLSTNSCSGYKTR